MCMSVIPALGRQRQADSEFEASLVYRVSSRSARATQRNPVLKKQKTFFKIKNCNLLPKLYSSPLNRLNI